MIDGRFAKYVPASWQDQCQLALKRKWSSEGYQAVPDHFQGDFGAEGYTTSSARIVQCYCPDQHYPPAELYEKQRDKVTTDLGKLKKNIDKFIHLTGQKTIKEWIFLTPRVENKALLEHCAKKRDEMRSDPDLIGKLDPAFDVLAWDEEYLAVEIGALRAIAEKLGIAEEELGKALPPPSDDARRTLVHKLSFISKTPEREQVRFIEHQSRGRNALRVMEAIAPQLAKRHSAVKRSVEAKLANDALTFRGSPPEFFGHAHARIADELEAEEFRQHVEPDLLQTLIDESISDWLLRCPLSFDDEPA